MLPHVRGQRAADADRGDISDVRTRIQQQVTVDQKRDAVQEVESDE